MAATLIEGGVTAAVGFKASGIHCGIRKNKMKKDLALIVSETLCDTASVYTQNKVKGSPILVTKEHSQNGKAQAIIVNSGNANTCNADGVEKANRMCRAIAPVLGIDETDVLVASTGVIGQPLPIEPIEAHAEELAAALSETGSAEANEAILTTDTKLKEAAAEFLLDGRTCHIGGIAKGSGMIHPNMATMLGFITSDVNIDYTLLQKALSDCITDTFNMVSVDGDTSTNDMVTVLANGMAGNERIVTEDAGYAAFREALMLVCMKLSRMIAKDGEGASKLLECVVTGIDTTVARKIAKSVITSSLTKCAFYGADANWGRILCAIGYCDEDFDISKTEVSLESAKGSILVCENGAGVAFSEEKAKEILLEDEIIIRIDMHDGEGTATAYGCDLTHEYVTINGDYRT
ncbi:bifunctional glutamate N-acetyltransferase/amino-acid acetyltransferase ArgJ [Candidatus Soleaferrea massiliensis]|uniref:bifunctional glutamate N-acetyltransferase/amino-acid acetyltransferase ArgJ n=1 Tax=Candidatus Soleaferrea massiliensis TaxID=1470354 RepID=UPI00058B9778|nr:bifunctional glutamate N-acetyltransferase/amino-acid acetyltransferase ArgJ [Candidatus Soleaferrea massiliensis]